MRFTLKTAAVITIIWAFILAFMIQDANMTVAIATRSLTASAASLGAYLTDLGALLGGAFVYRFADRF